MSSQHRWKPPFSTLLAPTSLDARLSSCLVRDAAAQLDAPLQQLNCSYAASLLIQKEIALYQEVRNVDVRRPEQLVKGSV